MSNVPWSDDRVTALSKLWQDGLSASQIAKQLGGVTRNAVIGKVHRLGLSGRATPSRPARRQASPAQGQRARSGPLPCPARRARPSRRPSNLRPRAPGW